MGILLPRPHILLLLSLVVVVCGGGVGSWPGLGWRCGAGAGGWGFGAGSLSGGWGLGDAGTWIFLIFLTFLDDLHP